MLEEAGKWARRQGQGSKSRLSCFACPDVILRTVLHMVSGVVFNTGVLGTCVEDTFTAHCAGTA